MARLVFGMNLSLDGYADHESFAPDAVLFDHWTQQVKGSAGAIYGRKLYEIMRYWDEDQAEWGPAHHAFALAWRDMRKWVVSGVLREVGPNAVLLDGDLRTAVSALKALETGQIDIGGPALAQALGEMGLIDEYRLYYHPVVLGSGRPFFAGALPRLRLVGSDRIGPETMRLTYVPA